MTLTQQKKIHLYRIIDDYKIPSIWVTFDVFLYERGRTTTNSNREIYWVDIDNLNLKNESIQKLFSTTNLGIKTALLISKGHPRTLEYIHNFLQSVKQYNTHPQGEIKISFSKVFEEIVKYYQSIGYVNTASVYSWKEVLNVLFSSICKRKRTLEDKIVDSMQKYPPVGPIFYDSDVSNKLWQDAVSSALCLNTVKGLTTIIPNLNIFWLKVYFNGRWEGYKADNPIIFNLMGSLLDVLDCSMDPTQFENFHLFYEGLKSSLCYIQGEEPSSLPDYYRLECAEYVNFPEESPLKDCKILFEQKIDQWEQINDPNFNLSSYTKENHLYICPKLNPGFDSFIRRPILTKDGEL